MKNIIYLLAALLLFCSSVFAQGPQIISPEVHDNNTVTFRFSARNAKEVLLEGQFLTENATMTNDGSGIWSITVGPVTPDIYPYCFLVDGIQV